MMNITRKDSLAILPLSARSFNCLNNIGIKTIDDLLNYASKNKFNKIPNMGKKSIEEVENCITEIKIDLNETDIKIDKSSNFINQSNCVLKSKVDGSIVSDILIDTLNIPNRAKNSLSSANIIYLSELIGKDLEYLLSLKNMGKKTAEIVLIELNKIFFKFTVVYNDDFYRNNQNLEGFSNLINELMSSFGQTKEFWKNKISETRKKYPSVQGESFIYCLYKQSFFRNSLKIFVIKLLENNEDKISKHLLEDKLPKHLYNTTIIEEILIEMEMNNSIEFVGVLIFRKYPGILNFVEDIRDERKKEFLLKKLEGLTLAEIGEKFGVTRERVRQIISKILKRRPRLREDKYLYLYNNYNFTEEDFILAFDEPIEVYNYLEMVSKTSRNLRKNLDENLLIDNNISVELRKLAEKVIYKNFVFVDGSYVKKNKSELAKYVIKKYCKDVTKFDDFIELYKIQLEELGLQNELILNIEPRTYENKLMLADYVLWNLGRSFRYYNIKEKDLTDLFQTISLDEYENVEISSLKIFNDNQNLMKQYDIRDEYELHNLLKKVWPNKNNLIVFNRMPTIEIGKIDRYEQVLELLLQYAPISAENLAIKYEETYGIKSNTVLANYLSAFDTYYYNGIYSISYDNLPLVQYEWLKKILVEPFYLITEIKRMFLRKFPDAKINSINSYVLKTLNFRVYSGYIIKSSYNSAFDYFKEILTKDDIINIRKFKGNIGTIPTYSSILYKLRNNYEIIEFLPQQYINIRKLKEKDITIEKLKDYTEAIGKIYDIGEFFTIYSLRKKGFVHELDDLGFDEWFYSSILLENKELFSYQRIGGNRLFFRGKGEIQIGNMLRWILENKVKLDLYDLINLLKNDFNITIPKEKLLEIIKGTDLYYDTIMETVYIDYDTYFEEI